MSCSMPKSCIGCEHYDQKGYTADKHTPFRDWNGKAKNRGRVQFGECGIHNKEVFATEVCNLFESIAGVQSVEVINRPEPKEIRQDRLFS